MRFIYPAVVTPKKDGTWHASLPDLASCEADGTSVDDVLRNANQAAREWIDLEMHEEEPDLPSASDPEDIPLKEGQFIRNVLVIYRILEGWEE